MSMSEEQAEEFFDKLEPELKEDFKIPKKAKEDKKDKEDKSKEDNGNEDKEDKDKMEEGEEDVKKRPAEAKGEAEEEEVSPKRRRKTELAPPPSSASKPVTYGEVKGVRYGTDLWKTLYDGPIPPELDEKCRMSCCELCDTSFTSPIVAKTHYLGRNHEKKVRVFLDEWSLTHKTEMPKRRVADVAHVGSADKPEDQDDTFCHTCNLGLSSKIVAVSHYQGKNHAKQRKRLLEGLQPTAEERADKSGGFGIGLSFAKQREASALAQMAQSAKAGPTPGQKGDWKSYCMPCQQPFGTEKDYHAHIYSKEHKKRAFAQMGGDNATPEAATPAHFCHCCKVQCESEADLAKHNESAEHKIKEIRSDVDCGREYVEKRKPNVYFCSLCKIECTGLDVMDSHVAGRAHKRRLANPGQNNGSVKAAPGRQAESSGFHCEICSISTTDQAGLEVHKAGKKHKKKAAIFGEGLLSSLNK